MDYGGKMSKSDKPHGKGTGKAVNCKIGVGNAGRKYPAGYDKRGPAPMKHGAPHDAPNQRKD